MADGYYRVTEQIQQPPLATEIYVNKDFIRKPEEWFPVSSLQVQSGGTSEMYNNSNQYPPGYDNSYQYYGASYGYQGYGYQTPQPTPPGDHYPQNAWTQPPPGYSAPLPQQPPPPKEEPKSEAVVQEIQQQKATLTKQREDYVRKAVVLRRELDQLKHQKQELASDDRSEKELRSVLKDNEKLQDEINSKLKAILNVIEMLSSIIKDGKKIGDLEAELDQDGGTPSPKSSMPETRESSHQRSRSPSREADSRSERDSRSDREPRSERDKDVDKRFCYVYYDTGLHWCRACDKFPETAKELLQHLHSSQHQEMAKENEVDTTPWHKLPVEPLLSSYDDAQKKRIPIKGLQFFISAPSWYCKLCDVWIGDLHCASHHLKSQVHFQNYENFVEQNPHWETEWLKDRERAMTRHGKRELSNSDDDKKKKRKSRSSIDSLSKEKKKKKRSKRKKRQSSDSSSSSSSSSESSSDDEAADKGKSIRVAMRNMSQSQVKSIINEDMSKWAVLEKLLFEDARKRENERKDHPKEPDDELINQWMTITNPVIDKERNMLDTLKDRMRQKQDIEKAKMAEMERRRKEKEREELEMLERKRRQVREEAERAEWERKRLEQEEFNRILDKERSHVRFRAARENFRKRRSSSDEENEKRREKSKERNRESKERSRESTPASRSRKDSEHNRKSHSPEHKEDHGAKKKPPGPPSYKKLPFIGRMPLFKKKMEQKSLEKQEIKKEEYEPTRKTRFESGNLTRAFIPNPELVCFPMLSSIPPISAPPAPTAVEEVAPPPPLPVQGPMPKPPKAPAPPSLSPIKEPAMPPAPSPRRDETLNHFNNDQGPHIDTTYYQNYNHAMYQPQNYHYQNDMLPHPPLEPPPLPPDDDLAMLGICADDMAAQSF